MKRLTHPLAALALAFLSLNLAVAGVTDLADIPLANAPTANIMPNIAFILDDSGSMDYEYMPDGSNETGSNCYRWHGHNTLFYNPATTYLPPAKATFNADGTVQRFPNADFSNALNDGYFASTELGYDNNANGYTNLASKSSTGTWQSSSSAFPIFSKNHHVSSVTVVLLDGSTLSLLNAPTPTSTTDRDVIGAEIAAQINAKTSTGFTATYSSGSHILIITAPATQAGITSTPIITTVKDGNGGSLVNITAGKFSGVGVQAYIYYATHSTDPSSTGCAANSAYATVTQSSGIAAPGVLTGSDAAKTNYANWYSYYRSRAYLAKAAAGESFSKLELGKYRVGLFYINSIESGHGVKNHDLAIDTFSGSAAGTARANWFDRLYGSRKDSGTPLREALSRAGRMYAGKIAGWDPVQYSCQKNFVILATDGYWNNNDTKGGNFGTLANIGNLPGNAGGVGDLDGVVVNKVPAVNPPSYDANHVKDTLADVAYYYYHTDLRTTALGNCTGIRNTDVCNNDVPPTGTNADIDDVATHQHMTTFTIGLGVSGSLSYLEGYKTSTTGDYAAILGGLKSWPDPTSSNTNRIDDLWHAAVNGRGTYFSAKNAETFASSIGSALGSIQSSNGSGAAAATSNLQPTNGDNFIYIANYRTINWDGELSAYTIDLSTGQIAAANCVAGTKYCWQVSSLLANKIQTANAGSVLAGDADTRTIKTWSATGTNKIKNFDWSSLDATERGYFDNTKLTQYTDWSSANKTAATGELLVKYLRGQDRYEDQARDVAYGAYNRLYRDREKILGDIVHAQPVYVKAPFYEYLDGGYSDFKTAKTTRAATVYVAANDGMLHAFDAVNGTERWAYIPPLQLKGIWRLADKGYATNHQYFLDGPISVTDVYDSTAKAWKTILVGAMGKGGRGIYALDVTDPASPIGLWNFTSDDETNLGYTYGTPIVTKLGTQWVVLIASGYNNVGNGDGMGYVFVRDAMTGAKVKTLKTEVGSSSSPSGLAFLNMKVTNFQQDNTATAVYGGDLLGNMWRFNLDAADGSVATAVVKLGADKPITVVPEVGDVAGSTYLFFGTGRYLGPTDLSDKKTQSFYAIKDDGSSEVDETKDLASLNVVVNANKTRTFSAGAAATGKPYGWYFDLPTEGERINLAAQLYFGTILFASTIPGASECQPGGYGILYALDYATGSMVAGGSQSSWYYSAPLVGVTVALVAGSPKVIGITADGGVPAGVPPQLPISPTTGGSDSGLRIMWREISN